MMSGGNGDDDGGGVAPSKACDKVERGEGA